MTALYTIPIGFVKYKTAFFSEKICLNLAESDMCMLYWKQMQEKQHPKGGMRVAQADDERQFLAACYQRHRISMIRLAKCYAADSAADARVLTIYLHSVPGYLIDRQTEDTHEAVSYTHLRAHET